MVQEVEELFGKLSRRVCGASSFGVDNDFARNLNRNEWIECLWVHFGIEVLDDFEQVWSRL